MFGLPSLRSVVPSGVAYGQLVETARTQIRRAQEARETPRDRAATSTCAACALRHAWLSARRGGTAPASPQLTGLIVAGAAARLARRGRARAAYRRSLLYTRAVNASKRATAGARVSARRLRHAGCLPACSRGNGSDAAARGAFGRRSRRPRMLRRDRRPCRRHGRSDATLARRNIEAFERSGADVYVVNAAGCGSALKEYGELFGDDPAWSQRARRFSQRVRDVTEVLDASRTRSAPRTNRRDGDLSGTVPSRARAARQRCAAPAAAKNSRIAFGRDGRKRRVLRRRRHLQPHRSPRCRAVCSARKIDTAEATGAQYRRDRQPGLRNAGSRRITGGWIDAQVKHVVELLDEAYRAYGAAVTRA